MNLSTWWVRAAIVGGLTYAAYKYLPVNTIGKTVVLAIGGVSAAGIVANNVPVAAKLLSGSIA